MAWLPVSPRPVRAPLIRDGDRRLSRANPLREALGDRIEQLYGGQGLTPYHGGEAPAAQSTAGPLMRARCGRCERSAHEALWLCNASARNTCPLQARSAHLESGGARKPPTPEEYPWSFESCANYPPLRFSGAGRPEQDQLHVAERNSPPCHGVRRCGAHRGLAESGLSDSCYGRTRRATFLRF